MNFYFLVQLLLSIQLVVGARQFNLIPDSSLSLDLAKMTTEPLLKSIPELWDIYDNWLHQNWEEGYQALNPPITDDELAELENTLGLKIPDDFKQSLQIHNGLSKDHYILDNHILLSSRDILGQYHHLDSFWDDDDLNEGIHYCEPSYDIGIKPNVRWSPKWIPITMDGAGDQFYCLDLDPSSDGNVGQVIEIAQDNFDVYLIAPSFQAFFNEFVDGIISGKYVLYLGGISNKDIRMIFD